LVDCEEERESLPGVNSAPLPSGTVTFLFSDIEGSTELVRRLGDDGFAAIRAEHRRILRQAFAAQDGREIDTAGDGFFIAFDSAKSAALAAISAQVELATFVSAEGADVRVRIGLHTAEPHLADDGYVGLGVHRAARICDAAHGGQILVSNATAGILEDAELPDVELIDVGEHQLKGLTNKQRLFQLQMRGLPTHFAPPRTPEADAQTPGIGTFMLMDLSGSGRVIEDLGDEATDALLTDYQAAVTEAVETTNGVVLERAGDNALAVFRDAGDALRAADSVRQAVRGLCWQQDVDLPVEITVHSGRWSGNPQKPSAGTALSRLSRLALSVEPGQVLVSQTTAALLEGDRNAPQLRGVGTREIRELEEPVRVYELVERDEPARNE
jgi:class 3 adenylate cyclase